jgi:DNA modification methylase
MDCVEGTKLMDDESVNCCVTSPPYWGLRDYGISPTVWPVVDYSPMPGLPILHIPEWNGCLGLEPTIEMFVGHIVLIFREVRRVLRKDGTLWLNLGDTYATGTKAKRQQSKNPGVGANRPEAQNSVCRIGTPDGLKTKDLIGIPWRVAFALQADGWYLRSDIIWAKPNPMPESVTDRPTKSHEYIFLFSKSSRYYYDNEAIKEPCVQDEMANGFRGGAYCNNSTFENNEGGKRKTAGNYHVPSGWDTGEGSHGSFHRDGRRNDQKNLHTPIPGNHPQTMHLKRSGNVERKHGEDRDRPGSHLGSSVPWEGNTRNKRTVWTVATQPFSEAHFATFPPKLIEPCILAGCPVGGVVLDTFVGSGTTAMVATQLQRNYIGLELNPKYITIAEKSRLKNIQLKIV